MAPIIGINVDAQGRCTHYHGSTDVAGMWCARCQQYFACYLCHDALRTHVFVPADPATLAVICGACGRRMNVAAYQQGQCPQCGHPFNPRCRLHASHYFAN